MNREQAEGNWNQFKGKVKETWGKLTDDDIALLEGKRDKFFGRLQEAHGVAREEGERMVKDFEKSCGCSSKSSKAA
ncbi:MAG: CsbD family protein [Alphaproteobacteria bacterium]